MNKTQYVVAFAHTVMDAPVMVPLVLKNKPEHLKGMYNLVGGKLKDGEDVIEGAVREMGEETGLEPIREWEIGPDYMGRIEGTHSDIYCVDIPVTFQELKPGPEETEEFGWFSLPDLLALPNLMPNLRVTIPLMLGGLRKWVVVDHDGDWREKTHHRVLLQTNEEAQHWNPWVVQVRSVRYYALEEEE